MSVDTTSQPTVRYCADKMNAKYIHGRPEPEVVAVMVEECERLLGLLTDPVLNTIALRKMEGFTNVEIAAELGVVCRSVERKLNLIRRMWKAETDA